MTDLEKPTVHAELGLFLLSRFAGFGKDDAGSKYIDVYLRSGDERFAADRFSVQKNSVEHEYFAGLAVGEDVTVKVSTPRIRKSKAGNDFLSWFIVAVGY